MSINIPPTNETTPSAISSEVTTLCKSIGAGSPQFVPVQSINGRFGWCFLNVREKTRVDKGTCKFGWTIWEFPRLYLTAEFHAVWQDPAGPLIDITPKPDEETQIVFAEDAHYPPDFDFYKRPNNRRVRIYKPAPAAYFVADKIKRMSNSQRAYESDRADKTGVTLEHWIESKIPIDPLSDAIDTFLRCADELDRMLTPTPQGMVVSNQNRFVELQKTKLQLFNTVRTLSVRLAV